MLKLCGVIMLQQLQEHSFIKSAKPPAAPQQCRNDGVFFLTDVDLYNTFVLLEAGRVHQLFLLVRGANDAVQ